MKLKLNVVDLRSPTCARIANLFGAAIQTDRSKVDVCLEEISGSFVWSQRQIGFKYVEGRITNACSQR